MITYKRIDHVQICIPKGEELRARTFYCDVLGMEEIEKPNSLKQNGGFWLQAGDIQIHIGTEEMSNYNSKRHPAFEIEDLEVARKQLAHKNIPIQDEKPIPGVNRFSFYDPFRNRIEFLEYENRR